MARPAEEIPRGAVHQCYNALCCTRAVYRRRQGIYQEGRIMKRHGLHIATRAYVKGYENLHGHKIRFETTWLDKKP